MLCINISGSKLQFLRMWPLIFLIFKIILFFLFNFAIQLYFHFRKVVEINLWELKKGWTGSVVEPALETHLFSIQIVILTVEKQPYQHRSHGFFQNSLLLHPLFLKSVICVPHEFSFEMQGLLTFIKLWRVQLLKSCCFTSDSQ